MGYTTDDYQVKGNLFTENGKWKYAVALDYSGQWDATDPKNAAKNALRQATDRGTSGVTIREIPPGWWLVVLEPNTRFAYPIMVRGD